MEDFLSLDEPLSLSFTASSAPSSADSLALLREAKRRWALKRDSSLAEVEKGPDEIVRMWEDLGGLGRKREGNMQSAVRELRANVHDGAVAGSVSSWLVLAEKEEMLMVEFDAGHSTDYQPVWRGVQRSCERHQGALPSSRSPPTY